MRVKCLAQEHNTISPARALAKKPLHLFTVVTFTYLNDVKLVQDHSQETNWYFAHTLHINVNWFSCRFLSKQ